MGQRDELREIREELRRLRARIQMRPIATGTGPLLSTTKRVEQTAHGLAIGNVIRHNGTSWTKSKADSSANSVVGGVVIAKLSADVFIMATAGYVAGLSGLTAGAVHYLDATTAGALTTTAPSIAVPILHADTTSSGVLMALWGTEAVLPNLGATKLTTLTSGTSYSTPVGAKILRFIMLGAGGDADLGVTTDASGLYVATSSGGSPSTQLDSWAFNGGSGSGAMVVVDVVVAGISSFTYAIGAASAGADGGDTTLTVSGNTLIAGGGKKGEAAALDGAVLKPGRGGLGGVPTIPALASVLGQFAALGFSGTPGGTGDCGVHKLLTGGSYGWSGRCGQAPYEIATRRGYGSGTWNASSGAGVSGAIEVWQLR